MCGPADATAIICCLTKIHIDFTFLVSAYQVVLEKMSISSVCLLVVGAHAWNSLPESLCSADSITAVVSLALVMGFHFLKSSVTHTTHTHTHIYAQFLFSFLSSVTQAWLMDKVPKRRTCGYNQSSNFKVCFLLPNQQCREGSQSTDPNLGRSPTVLVPHVSPGIVNKWVSK